MPYDNKYGRVTLENQHNIGDDEPVVVFRAQDVLLPRLLGVYHNMCLNAGSPENHLALIDQTLAIVNEWQAEHHTQVPQSKGVTVD